MLASQKTKITELFKNALAAVGAPENTKIVLERPKQQSHGDIACTVALQCAKAMKQPPRVIAEKLVEQLRKETADSEMFSAIEIAGPGFINLKLAPSLKQDVVREILKEGPAYGCSDAHTGESILLYLFHPYRTYPFKCNIVVIVSIRGAGVSTLRTK